MALPFYNWSTTAASNATSDSTVNWQEGQAPSTVNDSARNMMASAAAYRNDTSGQLVTGGTSTAYTLTTNQVFDTLAHMDGQELSFYVHATNGASPTLNVDGLGAKTLVIDGSATVVPTGALVAGANYTAVYVNSVSAWRLKNFYRVFASTTFSGALTISSGGLVLSADTITVPTGSASAPSYSFASDSNTGIYRIGADNIGVTANGAKVLDISTTGLAITGTLSATGGITATNVAAQADQETGTSTTTFVSPGRQQFHPSAAKAWAFIGSTGTIQSSYNFTSTTHPGTGQYTATFTTAMSSASYAIIGTVLGSNGFLDVTSQTANTITYATINATTGGADFAHYIVVFGDQ